MEEKKEYDELSAAVKKGIPLLWWPLWVLLGTFALDLVTKFWIIRIHPEPGYITTVIPHFFHLVHARNTGCAWSILSDYTWLLALVSVIAFLAMLLSFSHWNKGSRWRAALVALLIGGIAGNMFDRIFLGSVTDFLDFQFGSYHWPAFNVADSAIVVSVILLFCGELFQKQSPKKKDPAGKGMSDAR